MWVTDSRMLCSRPRSCLVHPVDRFDSEGWFISDQVISLTVFRVVLVKRHAAFKWKGIISGFPVSPGSAEALVTWGGKINYILIAYFLGNICTKNCRSRTVYVKIIASQRWDVFLRHSVYCVDCDLVPSLRLTWVIVDSHVGFWTYLDDPRFTWLVLDSPG